MIRKSLFAAAAVALLPTFAIAAPAAMTAKPAVAHTQTVKTKHVDRHHKLNKGRMLTKVQVKHPKKA